MINLRNPPKNPEELYEFFMNIVKPPVKSHVAYIEGTQYIRENWVMSACLDRYNRYGLWFYCQESDPPRWYDAYEKFIQTKE